MTEDQLIAKLTRNIPRKKDSLILGIGDDASIISMGKKDIVISCDSLVENVHFKRGWASWETWGIKAASTALSDIAAMGALPKYAWINLELPKNITPKELQKFYKGLLGRLKQFSTLLAGGNITRSPKGFGATLMVWGEAPQGTAMRRSQAKPGEKVYISGPVGVASFKPTPQIKLGDWLRKQGCRCCIDVSDGLLKDLSHIAQASNVRIVLKADQIPHKGNLKKALTRGEDYVLAFTLKKTPSTKYQVPSTTIIQIGIIKSGKPNVEVVDSKGNLLSFPKLGFDHKIGR